MFHHDTDTLIHVVSAFKWNDVGIGSLIEILVDSLHNWLRIGCHFPVTPTVCYHGHPGSNQMFNNVGFLNQKKWKC